MQRILGAALSCALVVGMANACVSEPPCGNGVIDEGEVCDDGNATSGDGCSASCALDDDASTPGDDRAGYVLCRESPSVTSDVVCAPGQVCCLFPSRCEPADGACGGSIERSSCDGPEDCSRPGDHCEQGTHSIDCTSGEVLGTYCHRDADCMSFEPWLGDGTCTPQGSCNFPPLPPADTTLP